MTEEKNVSPAKKTVVKKTAVKKAPVKKTETPAKKAKEEKAPRIGPNQFDVVSLALEHGRDPKAVRATLRRKEAHEHGTPWVFDNKEKPRIMELLGLK